MVLCQYSIKFYYVFSHRCLCEHWTGNWSACVASVGRLQSSFKKISAFFETPHNLNASQIHPGFQSVCLDLWVLQVAWLAYRQTYEDVHNGPQHKKCRHIAYRQYVRWVHGHVGKNIRVAIPSCAVSCIRVHFPPTGDEENCQLTGFRYPEL